ncbi:pilin [Kibdelosporangium philippinense]
MRLIDRFPTAAVRPRRTRSDGRPQSPAQSSARSATPCVPPNSTHHEPSTAPMTASGRESGARRARRSRRVLLVVEIAALALVLTASTTTATAHADVVVLALADSVTTVLNNVRNWIMGILAGLATVFLSIGGVRYVMGGGDPGEVEKAKTAFKSAGWGYGLAALAPLVVEILKGIVGA